LKSGSRCHTNPMTGLQIGEVARQAGVTTATVRYYERAGLLPKPPRSAGGYRLYATRAVEELVFIRRAQSIGFSLDEIRELLRLSRNGTAPCSRVLALAEDHLKAVESRIRELQSFKKELASAVVLWRSGRCGFTPGGLCDLIAASRPVPRRLHASGNALFARGHRGP
jgi:DNA-binding transcriptional MerR regulator